MPTILTTEQTEHALQLIEERQIGKMFDYLISSIQSKEASKNQRLLFTRAFMKGFYASNEINVALLDKFRKEEEKHD
jgi:hypothetical protein